MTKNTGHVIRIIGLVIEMAGVWGVVYRSRVDNGQARLQLPGGSGISWPWIAVGVGFVIWLTGRLVVASAARSQQKAIWESQRELTP
jgi:hypothetical protein